MSTAPNSLQLLDQLQNEVSRVLEQTGRVFAAAQNDTKNVPVVQISKLKQIIPGSTDRFHMALDQLEHELQLAKLVMRRDLAICRERSGQPSSMQVNGTASNNEVAKQESVDSKPATSNEPSQTTSVEDVSMHDAEPNQPSSPERLPDKVDVVEQAGSEEQPKQDHDPDDHSADSHAQTQALQPEDTINEKPSESTLQIDTKPKPKENTTEGDQQTNEEIPPDTGTLSNTNDLDSLFGGPASAGPGDAPTDFNMDSSNIDEFDFTSFGNNGDNNNAADSDNISSLLPGLQDYANTQPNSSGEPDFDALFSTDMPIDGQQGNTTIETGDHRDSTFDDLMDFADFNEGDFAAGNGGSGGNANQEFDFSFD
ncbi:hypothetical protein LTR37_011436 [Vermiconidia calcicola]|uniref:Uncharacterized protein n=1 Tax=Vermiconidia calcicola TaxID=1690605 RepID=A0ACC3N1Z2_9PEZI|nr:hypothetical protein LTR37_011436 [Vermiconidia calcicola]